MQGVDPVAYMHLVAGKTGTPGNGPTLLPFRILVAGGGVGRMAGAPAPDQRLMQWLAECRYSVYAPSRTPVPLCSTACRERLR
jgi:hypothetical protein